MTNLFDEINPRNKEKILKMLEANYLTFKKNTNIFSTIKKENIIGIVENGNIQIIENDYNGNRIIIEDLKENDIFGSMISSITNQEYDVITKEDTDIILIDYDRIINSENSKYEYYNQFLKNLLKIISDKIQEKTQRIDILTKKSIRNKLLQYFANESKKNGLSKVVYLPFSYTELADYLAVDRCAMSRELKFLKEEGFIEVSGRKINLLY